MVKKTKSKTKGRPGLFCT